MVKYRKKLHDKQQGFTLIESLVVLVLIALLLLVLFIAVPQAQKNSRNNRRRHDLSKFYSAITEYQRANSSNNRAPFSTSSLEPEFNDFQNEYLDSEFDIYTITHTDYLSVDHSLTPEEDEIIYFPFHYCDNDPTTDDVVRGTHTDSYVYAVVIGMEDDFTACLDNGDHPPASP